MSPRGRRAAKGGLTAFPRRIKLGAMLGLIRGFVFFVLAWLLARGLSRVFAAPQMKSSGSGARSAPPRAPERLLACAVCGIHFPEPAARRPRSGGESPVLCSAECEARHRLEQGAA
ncbi:MAG: hypothetical protein Q9Q13_10225 [Acidobacteriota bacterium]|nr:hypothetical protein [Acidobacteriota bacterium]